MKLHQEQVKEDLELVRSILDGSEEAWQRFILDYAKLINSVLLNYCRDEDDARTVFVDVLEHLRHNRFAHYAGRARLSTWVVVVTRRTACDYHRKRLGRFGLPERIKDLAKLDQDVFRLFFVDGMSFEAVCHRVRPGGPPLDAETLAGILQRLEGRVSDRVLRRLAYEARAASIGGLSGRMLEYLDELRSDLELASRVSTPEFALMEKEACETARRVREELEKLPAEDQLALKLRFYHGATSGSIAQEMGLGGAERAKTLLRRGLRRLRRALEKQAK